MTNRELKEHNKKVAGAMLFVSIPLLIIAFAFVIAILI